MDSAEMWRPVPGFPAEASNLGRVKGPSGEVLKPYVAPSGHLHVLIRRRKLRVHHAILLAFGFPRPAGLECRHLDGDPTNNTVTNLRWGTKFEQHEDDRRNGVVRAKSHHLNAEKVRAIRENLAAGSGIRATAREVGVSHTTVISVRDGRLWKAA